MSRYLTGIVLLACWASEASAQLTRAYISGTVEDSSGACIPGVSVTIINRSTGVRTSIEAGDAGVYRFAAVEPGVYDVEFSKAGFAAKRVESVRVETTQEVVLNEALDVASAASTVEVQATPPAVVLAKASASIDRRLDGDLVEAMPLRDATSLVWLTPLVVIGQGGNTSSGGQRNYKNNYTVDGISHNNLGVVALFPVSKLLPEAVGEFHVQTAAYSAEYGRNSGAQISAITRGGTNQWAGAVWDYFGSNGLESRNLIDKRNGLEKRRLIAHEAGGSIGGPIARNRFFFFALYENDTRRPGPSTVNATDVTIPTEAGFASLAGVPLAAGQTAQSRDSALNALRFLGGIYPRLKGYSRLITQTVNGVAVATGTTRVPIVNPNDTALWRGRLDHHLTARDSLTFTTQTSWKRSPFSTSNSNVGFSELFADSATFLSVKNVVSHTRTLSPGWINEARFGVTNFRSTSTNNDTSPAVIISGSFSIGRDRTAPFDIVPQFNSYEWQDVSSFAAGRHFLKAGVDLNVIRRFENNQTDVRGAWQFDNFAAFLNNQATSFTRAVGQQAFTARSVSQAYFVQDDFRASKNLTLTIGARYEYWNTPYGYFGATLPEVLAIGVAPPPPPDRNNWAPRFGLAYSPGGWKKLFGDGQTVIRGGYGIGYDFIFDIFTGRNNYPRAQSSTVNRPDTTNLFPNVPADRVAGLSPLANFSNVASDAQLPTNHFYSLSIQRQFRKVYVAEIGYTGNRSYHLELTGQSNYGTLTEAQAQQVIASHNANAIPSIQQRRLNPDWGSRSVIQTNGLGYYNGLLVRLDRRFSHGFLLGANYVWSCSMSDETSGVQRYDSYRNENGRALNDRPHRIVVHYSYELPAVRRAIHPLFKAAINGWRVTGFSQWQAGAPFNVTTNVDSTGTGSTAARPDWNPSGVLELDPVTGNFRTFRTALNGTGVFLAPFDANGRPLANSMPRGGNLGKQAFRGPGLGMTHVSMAKTFKLTERIRTDFRADVENLLNHRNFGPPVSTMNSANFGVNTSDPGVRSVRLSLKVHF